MEKECGGSWGCQSSLIVQSDYLTSQMLRERGSSEAPGGVCKYLCIDIL